MPLICREVCDISLLAFGRDVYRDMPNGNLAWMSNRGPSDKVCPMELMKSATVSKTYETIYAMDLLAAKG